jgi:hypothetical protein
MTASVALLPPEKLMPPELVPYAKEINEFKAITGVRLFFPPIGIGGGGVVLAAEDPEGAELAVKVIIADNDAMRDQARREADILASVQHTAALGGDGLIWQTSRQTNRQKVDLFFLAMEFVQGETLAEHLAQHGLLSERVALEWAIDLAGALAALHRQKIIHRDIKPDNIILAPLGRGYQPIVVDYGIAKVGNHTARGAKAATDGYAPPEQYKGGTDQRSDGYALGATLYEMVTGRTPPKATKRDASAPLEPRQLNPAISPDLELVIQVATAYEPDHRFPTMRAMQDALRLVQSGDHSALLSVLRATGLVPPISSGPLPLGVSGGGSIPQLPPLPMKQPTPKPAPATPPAAAAPAPVVAAAAPSVTRKVRDTCPHCSSASLPGAAFCDACGYALSASAQGYAAGAVPAPADAVADAGFCTPGPQFLSLLLGEQIILGGPALAAWEKVLLLIAYWLLLASLALGGRALSLTLAAAQAVAVGCVLCFWLLIPLFGKIIWGWKRLIITRRGQVRTWQRGAAIFFSLLALGAALAWCVAEVLAGQPLWALDGPGLGLLLSASLAGCAYLLIRALLA